MVVEPTTEEVLGESRESSVDGGRRHGDIGGGGADIEQLA